MKLIMDLQRILELLQLMAKNQQDFFSLVIKKIDLLDADPANWIDSNESMRILQISPRSLLRYRLRNYFRWKKIGQRYWFYKPDIMRHRDEFLK